MFLHQEDYESVCEEKALDILQKSSVKTRRKAEKTAMEEVASYLRPRYDMDQAFAAKADTRNDMIVQVTVNIALYYMSARLPQYMGTEIREKLYENAIFWLKQVQAGKASPDLPTYTGEDGQTDITNPMRFGSMKANKYDY